MSASPGYSNVFRLVATPELHASGVIISTVASAGAVITGLDVVDPGTHSVVLDLSCTTRDSSHVELVKSALDKLDGCSVEKVSDSTFLVHLGGKIAVDLKVPLRNRTDLARAYTPGVARVCMAIYENPADGCSASATSAPRPQCR